MEATMTTTPYSDQWREHTIGRMASAGVSDGDIERRLGFGSVDVLDEDGPVSLESAGPIDELLDQLEQEREASAILRGPKRPSRSLRVTGRAPKPGELVPVAVDIDALTNCDVHFTRRP
jgi:hypothetical protein